MLYVVLVLLVIFVATSAVDCPKGHVSETAEAYMCRVEWGGKRSSINQYAHNFRYYSRSRLRKYHCS